MTISQGFTIFEILHTIGFRSCQTIFLHSRFGSIAKTAGEETGKTSLLYVEYAAQRVQKVPNKIQKSLKATLTFVLNWSYSEERVLYRNLLRCNPFVLAKTDDSITLLSCPLQPSEFMLGEHHCESTKQ